MGKQCAQRDTESGEWGEREVRPTGVPALLGRPFLVRRRLYSNPFANSRNTNPAHHANLYRSNNTAVLAEQGANDHALVFPSSLYIHIACQSHFRVYRVV